MITVDELRKKAERQYDNFILEALKGVDCFPMQIRSNKRLPKDFVQMGAAISEVLESSKDHLGFGYKVISEPVKTRAHGVQDVPRAIVFESERDFLKFIGKQREFSGMMKDYNTVRVEIPDLEVWLQENPKIIIQNRGDWSDLVKVCKWFMNHYQPNKFYIRELPIAVHTKFIEEHKGVLRRLLDILIPEKVNFAETQFEIRYGLKYDQPLVRIRALDLTCWIQSDIDDISVPIGQLQILKPRFKKVFIIENKMNFLTFPKMNCSVAIWGKGFGIEILKSCSWLAELEIYYWSDLDVQGFQMLSQLRSYFPQVKSLLMDVEAFEKYQNFVVSGTVSQVKNLPFLTESESSLHKYLAENNLRLEQERIDQATLEEVLVL